MSTSLDTQLRCPQAYDLAQLALAEMRRLGVWPTPLNFELWLNIVSEPQGALGREVARCTARGEVITEARSEELADRYLNRSRLDEQMREAGDTLSKQLRQVQRAVASAQKSSAAYGRTLEGANRELTAESQPTDVKRLVDDLTSATREVQRQNDALEQRLTTSTGEVQRLRERLEAAQIEAMTDALSNLPNRKAFDTALKRALSESDETGAPVCLAMFDIDHFKAFNDTWGHQTGDQVIRYVASVLSRVATAPYVAARYGGEEFAIILPGETAEHAVAIVDAVRAEIGSRSLKRRSTDDDLGAVTVSIGAAQRRRGESAATLIERTDAALYDAKRNGRNRVTNAEAQAQIAA
jgi:diguanylate cyclase